jgi:hypothetical protein
MVKHYGSPVFGNLDCCDVTNNYVLASLSLICGVDIDDALSKLSSPIIPFVIQNSSISKFKSKRK